MEEWKSGARNPASAQEGGVKPPHSKMETPTTKPTREPRVAMMIATGLGVGYIPKAPGTAGSLLGVGLTCLVWQISMSPPPPSAYVYPPPWVIFFFFLCYLTAALSCLGLWGADRAWKYLAAPDPQVVVIDEIAGQLLTFVGLGLTLYFSREPFNWKYLVVGFILFRVFDIWKPWPARAAEKLPGGWGIMADDWVAGIYAAAGLWIVWALGL